MYLIKNISILSPHAFRRHGDEASNFIPCQVRVDPQSVTRDKLRYSRPVGSWLILPILTPTRNHRRSPRWPSGYPRMALITALFLEFGSHRGETWNLKAKKESTAESA